MGCPCVVGVIFAVAAGAINAAAPGAAKEWVYDCHEGHNGPLDLDCRSQRLAGKSTCNVTLELGKTLKHPIMLQYQLDEYYQNHRRYYDSVSYAQLHRHGASNDEFDAYEVRCARPHG